jgi:tetratricopeptide (TPR) repeat protein
MKFHTTDLLDRMKYPNDPNLESLRRRIYNALNSDQGTINVVDEFTKEYQSTAEWQPFRCAFIGIAYYKLGDFKRAGQRLELAARLFRRECDNYNEAIILMADGIIHGSNEEYIRSRKALKDAKKAMDIYISSRRCEYLDDEKKIVGHIEKLLSEVSGSYTKTQDKFEQEAYIAFLGLPIYPGVQAGPNGPMLIPPVQKWDRTDIRIVDLNDKPYKLFSLAPGNQQITLNTQYKYGWAKVTGDSMNNSSPSSIMDEDYVLFYESPTAENNAIVVASWLDDNGIDLKLIVKRYGKNDRCLYSDTCPPKSYKPISIKDDVKILGVVVAVAKPATYYDSFGRHG